MVWILKFCRFKGLVLLRKSVLNIHWKDWCWSWNSNTLDTWCEELTHLKRPWCWEGSGAGGDGDNRGWDGWMASPTRWLTHNFEWTLGVGDGQGGLAGCGSWSRKELDMTEWLNWTDVVTNDLGIFLCAFLVFCVSLEKYLFKYFTNF